MRKSIIFVLAFSVLHFAHTLAFAEVAEADSTASSTLRLLRITAEVPPETDTVYLPGNQEELGPWEPDAFALKGKGAIRRAVLGIESGEEVEFKFTLGSWATEALDENGNTFENFKITMDGDQSIHVTIPAFQDEEANKKRMEQVALEKDRALDTIAYNVVGKIDVYRNVPSKYLYLDRHVLVWLPPGYENSEQDRYPVIYAHDGQNLFDSRLTNQGVEWSVDETMVRLLQEDKISPAIVVGIYSTANRSREYLPTRLGECYARFLIEELKPMIDQTYRTKPGREDTITMGSSYGGRISTYLVWRHSDVFSKAACLSNAIDDHTCDEVEVNFLSIMEDKKDAPSDVMIYSDYGTAEQEQYAKSHEQLRALFTEAGWTEGKEYMIYIAEGKKHNEADWSERLHIPLEFLLGKK